MPMVRMVVMVPVVAMVMPAAAIFLTITVIV